MTTPISATAHTAIQPKPFPARPAPTPGGPERAPAPSQAAPAPDVEEEEVEHPFADIDSLYEGETLSKSEAEKIWDQDQSKDLFGNDGFGFDDFLDIINPLQHIPVISTIYRALTDDQIEPGARLAGGALFGGGLGFAGALINAVIENDTGKDVGEHALALVGIGDGDEAPADLAAAQATTTAAGAKTVGKPDGQAPEASKPASASAFSGAPVVPVQSRRGAAFGGIMIPPTGASPTAAGPKTPQSQAVDALLQARTAVPGRNAQTVAGAAANTRFAPGAGPKPDAARAAAPVVNPKDPISLSPTMAAKLGALARKTQPTGAPEPKRVNTTQAAPAAPAAPTAPTIPDSARRAQPPKSNLGTGTFQNATAPLPNIMLDALDKYELMVRERQKKRT